MRNQGADGVQPVGAVDSPDLTAVLAVVVHEHVLAETQEGRGVHVKARGNGNLKSSHVTWVSGIFQTVLIALQEELQLEPEIKPLVISGDVL